jgi:predicted DNA-binding antitoxin AbrB/MazE fold protein
MTMTIDAVYEAGRFRPVQPEDLVDLDLREGKQVKLTVDAADTTFTSQSSPDPSHFSANAILSKESGNESETETQARLAIVQAIAALAVSHGRLETASRDHDKFLYGAEGAR